MAGADSSRDELEEAHFESVLEALSSLGQHEAIRPIEYRIECALDGSTLQLAAQLHLIAKATKGAPGLPYLLYRGLEVTEAAVEDILCPVERSGDLVWLHPDRPIAAGDTVHCRISYQGQLPSVFVAREGDELWVELSMMGFWYPMLTTDTTNFFSFQLGCQLPTGLLAAANGDRVEMLEGSEATRYVWRNDAAMDMALLAGPFTFREYSTSDWELKCYARSGAVRLLDELTSQVGRIVGVYTERFGQLPFRTLSLVILPHSVSGNWGRRGLVVSGMMSQDSEPGRRFAILAHEIAHQWWGWLVRVNYLTDMWLAEGLAEFSHLCATLALKGEGHLRELLTEHTLPSYESARSAGVALADCRPSSPYSQDIREDAGAVFLALLRAQLGADDLDDRLRAFLHAHSGRAAATSDFEAAMTKNAPGEVSSFVHAWLHEPDLPEVGVEQIIAGLR